MRRRDVVAANRKGWNEAAPRHRARNHEKLRAAFRTPGFSCLDEVETARLMEIGIVGRDIAQPCCNDGRELVSVKNLGAGRCVGFDFSEEFLEQARGIAAAADVDVAFVHGDVHEIPAGYDTAFDVVYVTIGALCWMPKLGPFFAVAARLLRPGARVLVYEQHPILGMFEPFDDRDPPVWRYSYFKDDPWVDTDGLDYFDGTTYSSKPLYTFQHKLSDVFMACIDNGLAIERFEEFPHDLSPCHAHLERLEAKLPLSYALVARKAG